MKNTSRFRRLFLVVATLLTSFAGAPDEHCRAVEVEGLRPLEHADYDRWRTITSQSLSPDGRWAMYVLQSATSDGNATVMIRDLDSGLEYAVLRGSGARFTFDSRFAIYRIEPDERLLEQLERNKAEPEERPVALLDILNLETGAHVTIEGVKSFEIPQENGRWLAYHLIKSDDSDTVQVQESSTTEAYEVTREGLRRPVQPLTLKKREPPTATQWFELPPSTSSERVESEPRQTAGEPASSNSISRGPEQEQEQEQEREREREPKELGTTLVVRDLQTGIEWRFPGVVAYSFSKPGNAIALATSLNAGKTSLDSAEHQGARDDEPGADSPKPAALTDNVSVFDLEKLTLTQIAAGLGNYRQLSWNATGSELAFLTDQSDYQSETPAWELYHWQTGQAEARRIAGESSDGIPSGWWISESARLLFSDDGRRLFFNTAPIPEPVLQQREKQATSESRPSDEGEEEEDDATKANVDVWHWQDPLLQPQQLQELEQERRRSYQATYDLQTGHIVQLATPAIPNLEIDPRSPSNVAVANSNYRYRKQLSWDRPGLQDVFLVDLDTGHRHLLREEGVRGRGSLSPDGKFVTWWDGEKKCWLAAATGEDRQPVEISRGVQQLLEDELHDQPSLPRPYGIAGWLADDAAVLVYDRFDLWQLDPTGEADPVCVTSGVGRERQIRFRYLRLDPEMRAIDPTRPIVLSAFDERTKASGFYRLVLHQEADSQGTDSSGSTLTQLIMLDESLSSLTLAKRADRVLFRRATFRKCPDIWSSTLEFRRIQRVSDSNPQQQEYTWGTVELVRWQATDQQILDGLLYKPDGFDPARKYPLIVYFYERRSDTLHGYYPPAASRSSINLSFYVSRGYVAFVPDIPYTTGEPGQSAVNSVLSGVQHLVAEGFVDASRIGIQGHSWGGYQAAYLITQTDMFACAEAGAPVSNMTSAYGGIRWATGVSRMFQYEQTQSRIGGDLWSAQEKYIANSPLFLADNITTPLLILHNDEDGAVPWYQGIELFVALRRLGKPAWLLNYNGEPHSVVKDENRIDFTIRMQQFFDHYLLGAPEPEWMAKGVPAVDKGRNFGLQLLEPKQSPP